jgi:hypothetical protein
MIWSLLKKRGKNVRGLRSSNEKKRPNFEQSVKSLRRKNGSMKRKNKPKLPG